MDEEEFNNLMKAGEIAARARTYAESLAREGMKVLELAEKIEQYIKSLGGQPAFPVNISINEVAAHYTPIPGDSLEIPSGSVVKIDIGVHVEGFIADTATTVCFSEALKRLADACRDALEKALKVVEVGKKFSEVGHVIERTIKSYGFSPVYNLSGHSIDRYTIHAGEIIPNYRDFKNFGRFRDGRVYAIEPFASNGKGYVREGSTITIYALRYNPKKLKSLSEDAKKVFERIYGERRGLPFAKRWYVSEFGQEVVDRALDELRRRGLLVSYPVLIEASRGVVAQFEHTVVIYRGRVYVSTARF